LVWVFLNYSKLIEINCFASDGIRQLNKHKFMEPTWYRLLCNAFIVNIDKGVIVVMVVGFTTTYATSAYHH
jgi:hypothetical protein